MSDLGPAYYEALGLIITRLRRAQPRNQDTWAVCGALEGAIRTIQDLEQKIIDMAASQVAAVNKQEQFDRKAYMREYMREYMRRRRARLKSTDGDPT